MRRSRWLLLPVLSLALLLAACSGDDAESDTPEDGRSDATQTSTATLEPEATEELGAPGGDDEGDEVGSGAGTGTVTVGDRTWEVEFDNLCIVADQFINFASTGADGSGVRVTGTLQQGGGVANLTVLVDDPPERWASDPSQGGPIEYTLDGGHAEGTTTFDDGGGQLLEGSFEITCAE